MKFLDLIENKLKIDIRNNFALIFGLTPSKGARSPKLWNKVYKFKKNQIRMFPADVSKKNLKKITFDLKKNTKFIGGSVTAPYKVDIIKYLDGIDSISKKIGSINTLVKSDNKLDGFNTDYYGALNTLKKFKNKKKILILGCGGAGKAVVLATLKNFNKCKIFLFNRNKLKLKKFISKLGKNLNLKIHNNLNDIYSEKGYDLVINTTSIGFDSWIYANNLYYNFKYFSPLTDLNKVKGTKTKNTKKFIQKNLLIQKKDRQNLRNFFNINNTAQVFDIIYYPKKTNLMKYAKKNTINGLQMNLDQAVKAYQIVNRNMNFNQIKKIMKKNG